MSDKEKIVAVYLDEKVFVRRRPEVEHERAVAIYDLLEDNSFKAVDDDIPGPYTLHLSLDGDKLIFSIGDQTDYPLKRIKIALRPFRTLVRDYFIVCEHYHEAITDAPVSQIEAIDAGRRALHDEGAVMLRENLRGKVVMDHDTARRLFTLLCVLQIRG